jgi:hypothetical protein
MNKTLNKCPVCGGELEVTRLHCRQCDTTIDGHFSMPVGPLAGLTPDQVQFLLAFVRNEGRFTRLEQEMGLSYPTLRNRLYEIIRALGYEPSKGEEPPARLSPEERRKILVELEQGKITPADAQRRLSGKS